MSNEHQGIHRHKYGVREDTGLGNKYTEVKKSLEGLIKHIFSRKRCPYCNSRLKREKRVSVLKNGRFSFNGTMYNGEQYSVGMKYYCEKCQKIIEVRDLVKEVSHKG